MGATAKKAIGIMATAAAAAIVTILTDKAKVEFVNRDDTANDPTRSRTPIAEASAMINPITLLRCRSRKLFGSDMVVLTGSSRLAAVVGMKSPRAVRIVESPSLDVGWLQSSRGSKAPKSCRPTLRHSTMSEVK